MTMKPALTLVMRVVRMKTGEDWITTFHDVQHDTGKYNFYFSGVPM
jgi:hypothetical protein